MWDRGCLCRDRIGMLHPRQLSDPGFHLMGLKNCLDVWIEHIVCNICTHVHIAHGCACLLLHVLYSAGPSTCTQLNVLPPSPQLHLITSTILQRWWRKPGLTGTLYEETKHLSNTQWSPSLKYISELTRAQIHPLKKKCSWQSLKGKDF